MTVICNDHDYVTEYHEVNSQNNRCLAVFVSKPATVSFEKIKGAVFLFHGVGGSSAIWRHQIRYFVLNLWMVISMDLLGHGKSSKSNIPDEYCFQKLALDALYVFDSFKHHSVNNVVVGHSYGSSIVTFLSHERKDFISRMVLLSGGAPTPLGSPPFIFKMCDCFLSCIHACLVLEFKRRAFYVKNKSKISKIDKSASVSVSSRVLKAMMLGQCWDDGDECYHGQINIPTLLLYGSDDSFVSPEEEFEMLATMPIATLRCIANAGHMIMLEQPNLVNKYIDEHISYNWDTWFSLPDEQQRNENTSISTDPGKQSRPSSANNNRKTIPPSLFVQNKPKRGLQLRKNKIQPTSTIHHSE